MPGFGRRRRRALSRSGRVAFAVAGIGFAVLVVIGGFAAYRIVTVANDLRRARTLIDSAGSDIEQGRLGPARDALAQSEDLLIQATGRLHGQPELDLIEWLPVVGDNLTSLRQSVTVALQLVDGGHQLLDITKPLENAEGKLEVSLHHGAIPLSAVEAAQREAHALATALPTTEPSRARLIGPVADIQRRVYAEAQRRRQQLDNVTRALSILSDMSGASPPRRYLIAVANTAEMRGAGGMILSYGVLESNNGTFSLGDFGSIDELELDSPVDPAALKLPADYLARWAGFEPTQLWRSVTLAPDFKLAAPVMEAMFTKKTGLPVDGVIQIDPAGLAAVLEGTGPVEVPSVGQVTADNVVDLTINRAYIDFPNRDQRQEISSDVAKATFHALIDGDFGSLRPFGTALFNAAAARHLMFFSNAPVTENQVNFFGADGALPEPDARDSAILTVQNVGKNKLDYYVDTSLALTGTRRAGDIGSMTAVVTVANTTPPGVQSEYVTGPPVRGQPYATYKGVVSLYLPSGTTLAGSDGSASPPTLITEAGRTLVTYDVDLPAGASSVVTLDLTLVPRPRNDPYQMVVVPIGRVRPTVVAVDIDLGDGRRATRAASPLDKETAVSAAKQGSTG